ncbi:ABC transporter ATP-binding protein/permease [Fervidibacillus halotolerans]|uniref:ABC transporter ATP-binding protein/permease n=2 Tax=Fervidibacillus halotolerans TaxID=2980027 RepID=A0A9E8M3X7_9BACI|nr:ABC transporter ATP-binding protein [Fervidibacillus halotolerans]WAA13944.1 ABC transporter ATP-binding protein/permease [Fervidibacillus halotolerans]
MHRGPGPTFGRMNDKPKNFKGTFKRLLSYLSSSKYRLIFVFFTAILSTVFSIVSPKYLGKATTKIFEGLMAKMQNVPGAAIDFGYIANILLLIIGLYLFSSLFTYIQQWIMAGVTQKTVYQLRKEVDEKLSRLPLKYYDSRTHGEILSRVVNDVDNISNTLQQSLTQLITSLVTLVGVIVMMITINIPMTLIVVLTLPLSFVITRMIISKSQNYFAGQQKALGELNGHVEEMFTGHQIVKAYGKEENSIRQFNRINADLYDSGRKAQFISGIIMPLMMFVNNIGYVLVSVVGGIFVTKRAIAVGDVQAFIQYARQFSQPITQASNIANIIQSAIASAERIFQVLDEAEEIQDEEKATVNDIQEKIRFEHVHFRYKENEPLIEDLNIEVKKGQTVAIVGPTGAGKTTLVNLLMRFYDVQKGRITIDGIDLRDLNRQNLRSLFGMVLQDTWLFNGTIKENIAYGRDGATDEEIIRAAKAARADHFIRTLPDGYETVLNEEASNISQGQKQLLTIARAILADPKILILDEATSSVDTRTELVIQRAMDELMKGRTSFVIAHRLSTIQKADLILVMNHGEVIEQGTHEELLKENGFYADLYNSQFNSSLRKKIG